MLNETLWTDRKGGGIAAPWIKSKKYKLKRQATLITFSVDLSRDARKLLAHLRSLLKLRNLLCVESTGGLVRSGESEGMAVFLIGDSGWVSWDESR